MHRNKNQHSLAAEILRADLKLRRAIIIHGRAVKDGIEFHNREHELAALRFIDRAENKLFMLCSNVEPTGPAKRARLDAQRTINDSLSWTSDL